MQLIAERPRVLFDGRERIKMNRHDSFRLEPVRRIERVDRSHREVVSDWEEGDVNLETFAVQFHIREQCRVPA